MPLLRGQGPLFASRRGTTGVDGMSKIVAILGGGDWADASVDHVVLPDNANLEELHKRWYDWYRNHYCPSMDTKNYINFVDFVIRETKGREATSDDLEVYQDY